MPTWRKEFVEFLSGVDVLIHDAMYTPEELETHRGWGHSTYEEAVALAAEANARRGNANRSTYPAYILISLFRADYLVLDGDASVKCG